MQSFHSACGRAGYFLACAKKVTKESTPRKARPPGILPYGCAKALRRFAECTSVYTSERARIVRAPLGLFLRAFAAPYGAPVWRHPAAEATARLLLFRQTCCGLNTHVDAVHGWTDSWITAPFAVPSIADRAG